MLNFTSPKSTPDGIPFTLDGETYLFHPPKAALLTETLAGAGDDAAGQINAILGWLGTGLNPDHEPRQGWEGHTELQEGCQACRIEQRLQAPRHQDPLDIHTLAEVASKLIEVSAGRPPTNGGASQPSPPVSPSSTAGQFPEASTPVSYPSPASATSSTTGVSV